MKKKSKLILGIDPGLKGAMALISAKTGKSILIIKMPNIQGSEFDFHAADIFMKKYAHRIVHVYMEKVQAMPLQGVSSMFKFGLVFGALQGLIAGNGLRYTLITPQTWQKDIFQGVPRMFKPAKKKGGKKDNDPKAMALIAAKRLLPATNFVPKGCRVANDGWVDAALIGHWGYKQLKGTSKNER